MALVCVGCHTENRDAAKFCKGCGGKLVSLPQRTAEEDAAREDAWGVTVQASFDDESTDDRTVMLKPGRLASALPFLPSRSSGPAALPSSSPAFAPREGRSTTSPLPPSGPRRLARPSRLRWAVPLAVGVIVVVAAGWYVQRSNGSPVPAELATSTTPATPPLAVAPLPTLTSTTPTAAPAEPPATTDAPTVDARTADASGAAASALSVVAVAPPAPETLPVAAASPRKPRKQVTAAAPSPAPPPPPVAQTLAAVVVPVAAPAPAPAATPQSACAGRNFIAMAQCMATQCARPELSAHPQCEAVRRQQRIEEERRNPTFSN